MANFLGYKHSIFDWNFNFRILIKLLKNNQDLLTSNQKQNQELLTILLNTVIIGCKIKNSI